MKRTARAPIHLIIGVLAALAASPAVAGKLRERVDREQLAPIAARLRGKHAAELRRVRRTILGALGRIEAKIAQGVIRPGAGIRIDDRPVRGTRQANRGILATAGDPLHWGHISGALLAIDALDLDGVDVVLAGDDDRKPDLTPLGFRGPMAEKVLRSFGRLFRVSYINGSANATGEENFFRILAMNPERRLRLHYLVGTDHYRRFYPDGRKDTLEHLRLGVQGMTNPLHEVSAVVIRRDGKALPRLSDAAELGYPIHSVRQPFPAASSLIREGLHAPGDELHPALTLLPASALEHIEADGKRYAPRR